MIQGEYYLIKNVSYMYKSKFVVVQTQLQTHCIHFYLAFYQMTDNPAHTEYNIVMFCLPVFGLSGFCE
jgi:hypothetical protein